MTATIRYYSMNREDFQAGNGYTCERCGRRHRHVTEINGHRYGKSCGIKVMAEQGIIDTTPSVNYHLAEITAEDIKNIVNPTRRAFVMQDWINYQYSNLQVFSANQAYALAKHNTTEDIQSRVTRLAGEALGNDWAIVQRLQAVQ